MNKLLLIFIFLSTIPFSLAIPTNIEAGVTNMTWQRLVAANSNITSNYSVAVPMNQTIVFYQWAIDTGNVNVMLTAGNLSTNQSIRFNRTTTGSNQDLLVYQVVFNNGVNVQRGTVKPTQRTSITLTALPNVSQAFPMANWGTTTFGLTSQSLGLVRITDATHLEFYSANNTPTIPMLNYQVVSYDGSVVQNGTQNLSPLVNSVTIPITAVRNISQSFVYISGASMRPQGANTNWSNVPTVNFTGNNQITFFRNISQQNINVSWYVVDLGGEAVVQFVNNTVGNGRTNTNTVIGAVNLSRSVAFASGLFMMLGDSNSTTIGSNMKDITGTFNLSTTTNLRTFRTPTVDGDITNYHTYVIDFGNRNPITPPAPPATPTNILNIIDKIRTSAYVGGRTLLKTFILQ